MVVATPRAEKGELGRVEVVATPGAEKKVFEKV